MILEDHRADITEEYSEHPSEAPLPTAQHTPALDIGLASNQKRIMSYLLDLKTRMLALSIQTCSADARVRLCVRVRLYLLVAQ